MRTSKFLVGFVVLVASVVLCASLISSAVAQNGYSGSPLFVFDASAVVLDGDIIGPATANTAVALQHAPVSSTGPTAGQFLVEGDAGSWTPTSLSGQITCSTTTPGSCTIVGDAGVSVALFGDVTGTTTATVVSAVSGATPIVVTPNSLQWVTGATPNLAQATETGSTAAVDFTITPQTSTHATDQTGGGCTIALQTPAGAGVETFLKTTRGGTKTAQIGGLQGSAGYGAIYLGSLTPSGSNYALDANGTNTDLNGGSGHLYLRNANGVALDIQSSANGGAAMAVQVGGYPGGSTPFHWTAASVALTSGASNVLTAAQYSAPHIKFTGTLTGAGTTVTFPTTDGACWDLDFSAVVTIADSIALIANSQTWSVAVAGVGTEFPHVCYSTGVGRLVGVSMIE